MPRTDSRAARDSAGSLHVPVIFPAALRASFILRRSRSNPHCVPSRIRTLPYVLYTNLAIEAGKSESRVPRDSESPGAGVHETPRQRCFVAPAQSAVMSISSSSDDSPGSTALATVDEKIKTNKNKFN